MLLHKNMYAIKGRTVEQRLQNRQRKPIMIENRTELLRKPWQTNLHSNYKCLDAYFSSKIEGWSCMSKYSVNMNQYKLKNTWIQSMRVRNIELTQTKRIMSEKNSNVQSEIT